MKKRILCLAVALLMVLSVGSTAFARASLYIARANVYVYANGNNEIQIDFLLIANGPMDEIGVTQLYIEENQNGTWKTVKTYTKSNTPGFVDYDKGSYLNTLYYTGRAGCQYRAKVAFYVNIGNQVDTALRTSEIVNA